MPSFIIKPVADRDEYVVWSTVIDNVTMAGTRLEFAIEPELHAGEFAAERFERADATGSSEHFGSIFHWERDLFLVHNLSWTDEAFRVVRREDLYDFALAEAAEDADMCYALSRPVVEEDDE